MSINKKATERTKDVPSSSTSGPEYSISGNNNNHSKNFKSRLRLLRELIQKLKER